MPQESTQDETRKGRPHFAAYHQFRQQAHAVLSDYCAALHARATSPLPLSVQDSIARKADDR